MQAYLFTNERRFDLEYDIELYIFVEWEMRRFKVRQVLAMLKNDGWEIVRTRGDHRQLKNKYNKKYGKQRRI